MVRQNAGATQENWQSKLLDVSTGTSFRHPPGRISAQPLLRLLRVIRGLLPMITAAVTVHHETQRMAISLAGEGADGQQ